MNTEKTCNHASIDYYQGLAKKVIVRNKSILDLLAKFGQYNSRIERSIIKAATQCGCIEIHGVKQSFSGDSLDEAISNTQDQITGELCGICEEVLTLEAGEELYYLTTILDTFNISLSDIISKETDKMETMGKFMLK